MGGVFINIQYELSKAEFIEGKAENKKKCKDYKKRMFILNYVVSFMTSATITFAKNADIFYFTKSYILLIVILTIINKKSLQIVIKGQAKHEIYKVSVNLSDKGIMLVTDNRKVILSWQLFLRIVETDQYIHIYTDSKNDIFIPKKAFINEDDKTMFIEQLNKFSTNITN
ncbi:MAG: YcxB family protein [Clostridiaceae bacterium]